MSNRRHGRVGSGMLMLLLLGALGAGQAFAQSGTPPPLEVSVTLNTAKFLLTPAFPAGDPIKLDITVRNVSCSTPGGCRTVIVSAGFSEKPIHRMLVFTGPDGKPITVDEEAHTHSEGPPPRIIIDANGLAVQVDPLELLPSTYVRVSALADARAYYHLTRSGRYTVKAVIPVRSYPQVDFTEGGVDYALLGSFDFEGMLESSALSFSLIADADGDGYAYPEPDPRISPATVADCDDTNAAVNPGATEIPGNGIDDDCNPATPDAVAVLPGTIQVMARRTGGGPPQPVSGLPVRVFDRAAGSCASAFGAAPTQFKSIWLSCPAVAGGPTDATGEVQFGLPPGTYVVVGQVDPNGTFMPGRGYVGHQVGSLAAGQTKQSNLNVP